MEQGAVYYASKVEVAASLAKRHLDIQGSGTRFILVMKSGQVKEGIEGDVGGKLKSLWIHWRL